jgi:predicted negative regulator of RcsB-dependent stress response
MNINYKRKPDNEEMMVTYEFLKNNRNLIVGILVGIALVIIGFNFYNSSYEKSKITAADKLFEISKDFGDNKDDDVISKGLEYVDKYSGLDPAGDILILVARSYIRQNRTDEAIKILESNKNVSSNKTFKFAMYNILGGLYMDKWMTDKNPDLAEKAGDHYMKAAFEDRELHLDRTLYYAGNSYIQAGKNDKAKKALKPLYDRYRDLEYKLKEQVKFLYEQID